MLIDEVADVPNDSGQAPGNSQSAPTVPTRSDPNVMQMFQMIQQQLRSRPTTIHMLKCAKNKGSNFHDTASKVLEDNLPRIQFWRQFWRQYIADMARVTRTLCKQLHMIGGNRVYSAAADASTIQIVNGSVFLAALMLSSLSSALGGSITPVSSL
eukprot:gene17624-780_t